MLPHITATRFVTPLREGGSLPGIVEGSDDGTYVVKFRGAGQGLKVLVAEVVVGELARRLGIRVPQMAVIDMPTAIARYEADEEVQDLLNASPGNNLAVDFLPGSFGYDGSRPPEPDEAADIVWLDAFTANVDRTWANPNLLVWHRQVWAIDHGAAIWFHHSWPSRGADASRFAAQPFDVSEHVLRDVAGDLAAGSRSGCCCAHARGRHRGGRHRARRVARDGPRSRRRACGAVGLRRAPHPPARERRRLVGAAA